MVHLSTQTRQACTTSILLTSKGDIYVVKTPNTSTLPSFFLPHNPLFNKTKKKLNKLLLPSYLPPSPPYLKMTKKRFKISKQTTQLNLLPFLGSPLRPVREWRSLSIIFFSFEGESGLPMTSPLLAAGLSP